MPDRGFEEPRCALSSQPRSRVTLEGNPDLEEAHWRAFWQERGGLKPHQVTYRHLDGHEPSELHLSSYVATGIAVVAIDEIGHGASVYHDVEQVLLIDEWIHHGFLSAVIEEARSSGVELWLTADHGNIRCKGIGHSSPGVQGVRATTRVQLFNSREARSASPAPGIDWDVASTLPDGVFPRFAAGGDAYTPKNRELLTHGGLSLHEVMVPLARLT